MSETGAIAQRWNIWTRWSTTQQHTDCYSPSEGRKDQRSSSPRVYILAVGTPSRRRSSFRLVAWAGRWGETDPGRKQVDEEWLR